ncbi:phosphatase PAP2 family protein [Deminuibacter soli]|uniref:Phosphatase PAP2 family protein n=2 Tax=Deminuibacter soli TaxID=2291815 RepID=A0A3E1NKA1_9BACT|nr:phosphatase PAP2 family protein [Deminuibacter soli]
MVHDITNPPLAARFFAYSCLSGYEVIVQNSDGYHSMYNRLHGYPQIGKPDSIQGYAVQLSALLAMLETAQKMQPSGKQLAAYEQQLLDSCSRIGYTATQLQQSQRYARYISKAVLAYARADGYNKISNYARYTPVNKPGTWYPTPPAFLPAVEPYFKTVRTFVLDSSAQCKPVPPIAYSAAPSSAFYKLMQLNYTEGKTLPAEHRVIAAFWDCNPFAVEDDGHLQMALKKISPGAHWLGIAGIACIQAKKDFAQSMQVMTMVAIGLTDGFISCWDEKYRSNRIRPETAIRRHIDVNWRPLLQTPPFPEYPSGHSVISAAAACILTHYFGEQFAYKDSVEQSYGLPPRSFTSFQQAAEEAAISRVYGGIHFKDAADNGLIQGKKAGELVWARLGTTQ